MSDRGVAIAAARSVTAASFPQEPGRMKKGHPRYVIFSSACCAEIFQAEEENHMGSLLDCIQEAL